MAIRIRRWRCSNPMSAKSIPNTFGWPRPKACWLVPGRRTEERTMWTNYTWRLQVAIVITAIALCSVSRADDQATDDLVQMIVKLLSDKDKDLRALGLDQVRNDVKGAAATRQFAAQLPHLPAATQTALLGALADRADVAALPPVLALLSDSRDQNVR